MNSDQRIKAFARLGEFLKNMGEEEFQSLTLQVRNQNPWFTEESVRKAFNSIGSFLDRDALTNWINFYTLPKSEKKVAIVMAGNIPLVGFHDLLSVLISGNSALLKLSSKDSVLMNYVIQKLIEFEPEFSKRITVSEQLKEFDAVIATGSDNTSRYFDYYFGKYPNIIRKNRTSVGILSGTESASDLQALGSDVFAYFGLGCRNVSKLFVPQNYSFDELFRNWESFAGIVHHHKYCNNYDYQKSILLVNRQQFLDNGFVLLQPSERFVSPIAVVYYEFYTDEAGLKETLNNSREKIQVIVGNSTLCTVPFGQAQYPQLDDYADNVDTLEFLGSLQK